MYITHNPPSLSLLASFFNLYLDLIRNGHDMLDVHVLTIVKGIPGSGSPVRATRSSSSSSSSTCWVDKESSSSSSFSSSRSSSNNGGTNSSAMDKLVWSRPRLSFGDLTDLRPRMHLAAMKALPGRCHRCLCICFRNSILLPLALPTNHDAHHTLVLQFVLLFLIVFYY